MNESTLKILSENPPPRTAWKYPTVKTATAALQAIEARLGLPPTTDIYNIGFLNRKIAELEKIHAHATSPANAVNLTKSSGAGGYPEPHIRSAQPVVAATPAPAPAVGKTTATKPTLGPLAGEPSYELLSTLAFELFGNQSADYQAIFPGWTGAPAQPSPAAMNYECVRNSFFKNHVAVEGLSFEPCVARKTSRENYPVTKDSISRLESSSAFAAGFIAAASGHDTTGKEFATSYHRAGAHAGVRFIEMRKRTEQVHAAKLSQARANMAKAQQSMNAAAADVERAALKRFGL